MEYEEISTDGVFSVPLNRGLLLECMKNLTCTPRGASVFEGRVALNREIPLNPLCATSAEQIKTFIFKLNESVESRVSNIPKNTFCSNSNNRPVARLGILFSGGIDCSVLAYLANRHIPPDEPIDLLNVAFENPRTLGAQKNAIQEARAQRKRSKRERKEVSQEAPLRPPPVQVEAPPEAEKYDVPDRLTGLEEVEELRRSHSQLIRYASMCRMRNANVKNRMYSRSCTPLGRLALALYFASRGRGILHGSKDSGAEFYTSPAKVLLSGLGSDELLGGYSRHKQAYSRGGWDALVSEVSARVNSDICSHVDHSPPFEQLQLDLNRLPTRNLGRDDRVISTHGRESRYPFLSLTLVYYLAQLPVYIKLDPRLASTNGAVGSGMGDKTLLRLAAERLGLTLASKRIKRAMQFGSRSARMEGGNSEKKGHFLLE
ncbi:Asparagine synthase domain containing protein [Ceratobasidium theobromae]|uniref:Asparagine synthase domain containing protein n=1 Tax=Ceratobasidium theobromae TaxID=1582974 RepID=A0A5N5QQI9_9AGAM|nr:Asparagine synthase domain containing protein [Ceratobasidium theobromae]